MEFFLHRLLQSIRLCRVYTHSDASYDFQGTHKRRKKRRWHATHTLDGSRSLRLRIGWEKKTRASMLLDSLDSGN
jgi:hypothetical protein